VKSKKRPRPAAGRQRRPASLQKEQGKLIFLAWSGERSKRVARSLRESLTFICNAFKPWMSEVDIATGKPWEGEIAARLDEAQAAILCLTPENQDDRWVLFEAGAVAKSRTGSLVIPYLLDLPIRDLKPPLSIFQGVTSALDREHNLKMVRSLYRALPEGERGISDRDLEDHFGLVWPTKLHPTLQNVGPGPVGPPKGRGDSEVLDEILGLVRDFAQRDQRRAAADALLRGLYGEPRSTKLRAIEQHQEQDPLSLSPLARVLGRTFEEKRRTEELQKAALEYARLMREQQEIKPSPSSSEEGPTEEKKSEDS